MKVKKIAGLLGAYIIFMALCPAAFAEYNGYVDYDVIYDQNNYKSTFNENAVIAVMQPVAWGGSAQEYIDRAVFTGIELDGVDMLYRCVDPSDDTMGDVLMLRLRDGSREKVLLTIEELKSNEYVIYSAPDYSGDENDPDDNDEEIVTAASEMGYHLDGDMFYFRLRRNGRQILALYKDGRLVSSAIGSRISIKDVEFDTLKLLLWTDIGGMQPVREAVTLSRDEVVAAKGNEPQYSDIPKVYLTGDTTEMSKDNKVTLSMKYESKTGTTEGYLTAKWQGNAAVNYPKKNYSIKLYKDETLAKKLKVGFKDWDSANNFVLKANYIDATSARNIVSARLYETLPGVYLQNGTTGEVDGFPVRLYINGVDQGLYTWNKPKKGWVFGMSGDTPGELLYFSNYALRSGLFLNKYSEDHYWELVYPDEHTDESEFDRVTGFVATCSDAEFKEHIEEYMDLNSLLNYYVFAQIILHNDGLGKNMNIATYDGKVWYVRPYDMDATFGLEWYGRVLLPYDKELDMRASALWRKLEDNFGQEIYDRYIMLRNDQLREDVILAEFRYFMDEVGDELYSENFKLWPNIPGQKFMYDQIAEYISARYEYLDTYMEKFNTAAE